MKTILRIGLGIATASALVIVSLSIGWNLWGRSLWAAGRFVMPGTTAETGQLEGCGEWGEWRDSRDPRMVGEETAAAAPCTEWNYETGSGVTDASSSVLTLEDAHEAVEQFVTSLGYADLKVTKVMEFERNFYAIVQESDTGIGAMELLLDKRTHVVGPEMGPNMMWNGRYGMHGHSEMVGGASEHNVLSPEEALEIAQRWLDTYQSDVTVEEHADPFYGYYTVHTQKDGEIEGMLSVHGTTGQVWYHTWHGAFIQMIELENE